MTGGAVRSVGTVLGGVGAAAVGALAWGSLVERSRFTVRREHIPLLEAGARPLTVLHLADLHMAPWQLDKQEWIRGLAVLEPDLVISTGDNLGHPDGIDAVKYALEPFRSVPGVYVNGSNDYFGPVAKNPFAYFGAKVRHDPNRQGRLNTAELESFYASLGWLSLNNTARAMTMKGSRLEFVGVNDAHLGWDRLDVIPGAMDEMRENVGWQNDRVGPRVVTLGVTHAPYQRVLNSFVNHGAQLIFAGHTHGGQVCVPGIGALITNCDLPRSQASGVSHWYHGLNAAYLNVSAGLGTSIFAPVRFACPPEAVLVTLTADDIGYS
jgi:uncharacterized protein